MKIYASPNNIHLAKFINFCEIRFGPEYYEMEVNGKKIKGRVFSANPVWSNDDRYLAIQEWNGISESVGPNMKLCVIDFELAKQCSGIPVHGYMNPKYFEGDVLVYEKRDWSTGCEIVTTIELAISSISNWKNIFLKKNP